MHVNGASILDSALYSLFQALKFNTSLETLSLNSCGIDNKKALRLFEALTKNTTLKTLILDNNTLGGGHFDKIALLIGENKGLSTLSLKGSNIRNDNQRSIEKYLLENQNLELPPPNIEEIIFRKPRDYTSQEDAFIDLIEEITEQEIKKLQKQPLLFFTLIAKLVKLFPQELTAFVTPENRHSKKIELLYITTNALLDQIISEFNTNSHQLYAHAHCLGICFSLLLACETDEPFIQRKKQEGDILEKIESIKHLIEHFEPKKDHSLEFELKRLSSYLQYHPSETPSFIKQLFTSLCNLLVLGTGNVPESLPSLPKQLTSSSYITPHAFQAMAFWATESAEKVLCLQQFIHGALHSKITTNTKALAALTSLEFVVKYGNSLEIQKLAWTNKTFPRSSLRRWGVWEYYRQQDESTRYTICRILRELTAHPDQTIAQDAKELFKTIAFGEWSPAIQNFIEAPTEYDLWILGIAKEEKKVAAATFLDDDALNRPSSESLYKDSFGLPFLEDILYVARDEEQEVMEKLQIPNTLVAITSVIGGGGVGKTQLAKYIINHPPRRYQFRAWFEVEQLQIFATQCRNLAKKQEEIAKKKLFHIDDKTPNQDVICSVINWLSKKKDILLVYDNAPDFKSIQQFLPREGTVLVTSRNPHWSQARTVAVDIMTPPQAEELIKSIIQREDPLISTLAKEMGYLPLALAQSASHIQDLSIPIQDYLNLFYDRREKYLQEETLPQGDKHLSVWTTVKLAYEDLLKTPQAAELLTACALLAPESIPSTLLEKLFSDKETYLKMRALLIYRSLIKIDIEAQTLSIHRLTQTILEKIAPNKKEILEKIVTAFNDLYPWEKPTMAHYALTRELVPHAEALLSHVEPEDQQKFLFIQLLENLAHAARDLGHFAEAKEFFDQALEINQRAYDPDDVKVSSTLENLGTVERSLGHYVEAKKLFTQALEINQRAYDPDDVKVSSTLENLGTVERSLGHYVEAEKLFTQALEINQRAYGPDDVKVAITLGNLGNAERDLGHVAEAKELYTQALTIKQRVYGLDHVYVSRALENLGTVERELGHVAEAKKFFDQALEINQRAYGPDHVNVARTLFNIALVEKDLKKAQELYKEVYPIFLKHYGDSHSRTKMVEAKLRK